MFLKSKVIVFGCIFLTTLCSLTPLLKKQKIYMAGDSTMANKLLDRYPETGWGQVFSSYFTKDVEVINYAVNGSSTKTFINQKKWEKLIREVAEDDYVFIEFGHNDEKNEITVGCTLEEYRANLTKFVQEVKEKKAIPVLMTPLMRMSVKDGKFYNSHGGYPDVVRKVAIVEDVTFIDMLEKSSALLENTDVKESEKFFLYGDPGQLDNYPKGIKDNTHFSRRGALEMAKLAVNAIRELRLPLAHYLK